MPDKKSKILAVPTNIITGFLGVGKTSAILNLLRTKPADERWAILVNEFGEIGIDGSLVQGQHSEEKGIFIREVPGGCMCCTAGLPMQMALAQLLMRAKPDRLLIEPTGLGHPLEVLQTLSADHYKEVLSIQKIITLVDARKLTDSRYTEHATFNQQIAIADLVVGNKQDLYSADDEANLKDYVANHTDDAELIFTRQGEIDPAQLEGATSALAGKAHHHHHTGEAATLASEAEIPETGYLKAENEGEGFQSVGWRFEPGRVFSRRKLIAFLQQLDVERMKAVFITEDGIFGYNLTSDGLTETELDDCMESRIEIIAHSLNEQWEDALMACISA